MGTRPNTPTDDERRAAASERLKRRQAAQQEARRQPRQATRPDRGQRPRRAAQPTQAGWEKKAIALVLAVVAICVVVAAVAQSCAGPQQQQDEVEEETATQEDRAASIDTAALADILGDETAEELAAAAQTDDDLYWIATHYGDYAEDGSAVQTKLLKLALNEPSARSFVLGFPESYPQDEGEAMSERADGGKTGVPRLYQWDTRWGYTVYSSTTFALTGCAPTSLAMVYQGLTGSVDKTPYDMAVLARENGHETTYNGTEATFLTDHAASLGLRCERLEPSADTIETELGNGRVIIANMTAGDFTDGGHYIVLAGLDDEGKVIVNDPYSEVRSNQAWDAETIASQAVRLYSYSLA